MWGIRALQGDPPVRTGFDHLAKFCRFNRQEKLLSRKAHLAVVIRVKGFRLDRCLSRIRFLRSAYIVIANVCLEVIKRVFCLLTLRLMTLTSHTFGHHRSNAQKRARGVLNTWATERIWLHVSHKKGGEESSSPKPLVYVGLPWWIRWLLYGLPFFSRQSRSVDWNRISSFKLLSEVLASNPELCWSLEHLSDSPSKMRFLPTR